MERPIDGFDAAPDRALIRPPVPSLSPLDRSDGAHPEAGIDELGESIPAVEAAIPGRTQPRWRRASTWFALYGVALALIAFWPQPVDSGAGSALRWVTNHFPLLTYPRIEFAANIVLFVPLGAGLAVLLPRLTYLVMPVALLTSLAIESVQAVLIEARTPSLYDILANVSGAALGLVAMVLLRSAVFRDTSG